MKTILLDRDGVINKDPAGWTPHSYVTDPKDLILLPGVLKALRLLAGGEIKVVVVSNQAGVGKGFFTKEMLEAVTGKMLLEVRGGGADIVDVLYCTHKSEDNCECRKPKTGLLEKAIRRYDIDRQDTYFIGDSEGDVIAGKTLGIKTVFVESGKTTLGEMKREWKIKPDLIFKDLLEAVKWILEKEERRRARSYRRKTERRHHDKKEKDTDNLCDGGDRA